MARRSRTYRDAVIGFPVLLPISPLAMTRAGAQPGESQRGARGTLPDEEVGRDEGDGYPFVRAYPSGRVYAVGLR